MRLSNERMVDLIANRIRGPVEISSVVRAMFEEGKRLAAIHGAENVFDFSLGNPSVEPPEAIKQAIIEVVNEFNPMDLHGYMNNSGYEEVRQAIAAWLNRQHGTDFGPASIIMTVGAAGGLNVVFKTLLDPGDEVIVFVPFFGEYRFYVDNYGGQLVTVPPRAPQFQPDLEVFSQKISPRTKAVIINSPNNPTGVVYSEATIKELAAILRRKQQEFGADIYLISDEPYRELVYDGAWVPYLTKYYGNTIVGYSFSKSLSLPGERIGYLVIPSQAADFENIVTAANIATRILGFVNAPSLFQRIIPKCLDARVDIAAYNRNRELLYNGLISFGYQCVKPEGAFYLFIKTPIDDDVEFCNQAKQRNILMVPGTSYGCPGYARIAYCVAYDTIARALPGFQALIKAVRVG